MPACASRIARQVEIRVVEPRIVEGPAEEGHRIVAAGAEARRLHVPIPRHRGAPGFLHAEEVGRVVERAQHGGRCATSSRGCRCGTRGSKSSFCRTSAGIKPTRRGARQRRKEVLLSPDCRSGDVPDPGVLRVQQPACRRQKTAASADPGRPHLPADAAAGQAVQHEEPRGHERCQHVHPVGASASGGVVHLEAQATEVHPRQHESASGRRGWSPQTGPGPPGWPADWGAARRLRDVNRRRRSARARSAPIPTPGAGRT